MGRTGLCAQLADVAAVAFERAEPVRSFPSYKG
jgi:hypothetical protein